MRNVGCHTNSWSRGGRLFQRGRINYAADGEFAGCWPLDDGDNKVHLKLAGWILCATSKLTFPLDQSWLLPRWCRRELLDWRRVWQDGGSAWRR